MNESLVSVLGEQRFFYGMGDEHLAKLAEVASPVSFSAGSGIFHEGDDADACYLVLEGDIALELTLPGRGHHVIQTLHSGDMLGWSWLLSPYRYAFDAQALSEVRAVRFDAEALRRVKKADPVFGYELMSRFAEVLVRRMQAARLQLLDLYGTTR